MKKTITIVFFALFSFPLLAQWKTGAKFGANISNLIGVDGNSRLSLHAGLGVNHAIGKQFGFGVDVLYSGEGQHYSAIEEERTQTINYVQLPITVQFYPTSNFFIEMGPQVGVLVGSNDKGPITEHQDTKKNFNSTTASVVFGLGLNTTNHVGIYMRYTFGLTDVTNSAGARQSQVGQVGINWRFK